MIERIRNEGVVAHCDGCSEHLQEDTWQELMDAMRSEGWRTTRGEGSEWEHHCPSCVEDEDTADGPALPKGETW